MKYGNCYGNFVSFLKKTSPVDFGGGGGVVKMPLGLHKCSPT